jgi:hypothetical protein
MYSVERRMKTEITLKKRASAEPAKRAATKLLAKRPKPSERIQQIADQRRPPGFRNPPQVSIGDILRYLDEVYK